MSHIEATYERGVGVQLFVIKMLKGTLNKGYVVWTRMNHTGPCAYSIKLSLASRYMN